MLSCLTTFEVVLSNLVLTIYKLLTVYYQKHIPIEILKSPKSKQLNKFKVYYIFKNLIIFDTFINWVYHFESSIFLMKTTFLISGKQIFCSLL